MKLPAKTTFGQILGWLKIFVQISGYSGSRRRAVSLAVALTMTIILSSAAVGFAPVLLKYAIDAAATDTASPVLRFCGLGYILLLALGRLLGHAQWKFLYDLERLLHKSYRQTVNFFIVHSPIDYHLNHPVGETLQKSNQGSRGITAVLQTVFIALVPVVSQVPIAILFIASITSWKFGILMGVSSLAYAYGVAKLNGAATAASRVSANANSRYNAGLGDFLGAAESVRLIAAEPYATERLSHLTSEVEGATRKFQGAQIRSSIATSIVFVSTLGAMMAWAVFQLSEGLISAGAFAAIVTSALQILRPLEAMGVLHRDFSSALIMLEQGQELFVPTYARSTLPRANECRIALSVENVSFNYQGKNGVLKDINFKVGSGEKVALVGPSGSGKSTLVKLIAGLYILENGQISIGDTDGQMRQDIAILPQDTTLFDDTLKGNAKLEKYSLSDDEVKSAFENAGLKEFLDKSLAGLETIVGPRGGKISFGERQRVGLARILLRRPSLVVLDEPTSSLDGVTEEFVMRSLKAHLASSAMLIVAHRLRTIMDCDVIHVLVDGEIVESGNHRQLLAKNAAYARLWISQERSDAAIA